MLLLLQSQVSNGAGPSAAGLVYEREFGTGPTAAKLWVCCRTSTPFKIAVILYRRHFPLFLPRALRQVNLTIGWKHARECIKTESNRTYPDVCP